MTMTLALDRGQTRAAYRGALTEFGRQSLVTRLAAWMQSVLPPSGLVQRGTLAGTALSVAPLRYALRPATPESILCSCGGSCSCGDLCCDGYTAFCCTLTNQSNYACPSYAFTAGWWKCSSYTGSSLCHTTGVRYYLDCSTCDQTSCPTGGCHCANNSCSNRWTCCLHLRPYGQCHTGMCPGMTNSWVVCRLVTCINPSTSISCTSCTDTTTFIDDNTCSHEASCL